MSTGITRRGKTSWRINYDLGRNPVTGRRERKFVTFRGTKEEAKAERIRIMHEANRGSHVDASKVTVAEFLDRWDRDWASDNLSLKTMERFRELIRLSIKPHIGAIRLQKVRPVDLSELYAKLLREGSVKGGKLAPRTVGQAHRILYRALGHAALWQLVQQNVASLVQPPKVARTEVEILNADQVHAVLKAAKGTSIYPILVLGLTTGMRRGEILALRWRDVDFDGGVVRVERSLEETEGGRNLRFKAPKSERGRRNIAVPPSVVAELRGHWKTQQEVRLALGVGKGAPDDLVFPDDKGGPRKSNLVTSAWRRLVRTKKLPKVSLHAWRHTHVSQLIASGMDILTISRRIGHSSPSITLDKYGHLFANTDAKAAAIMENAFGQTLSE